MWYKYSKDISINDSYRSLIVLRNINKTIENILRLNANIKRRKRDHHHSLVAMLSLVSSSFTLLFVSLRT